MFFKYYLKLVQKNMKSSMLYFLLFIILSSIFMKNSGEIKYEETKLDIVVNNKSNDELSKKFVDYLKNKENVTEKKLTQQEAKTLILKNVYLSYIEIDENFEENLKNDKKAIKIIGDETSHYFIGFKINIEKYINYLNVALKENKDYKEVENTINTKINVNIPNESEYNKINIKDKYNITFYYLGYSLLSTILFIISNIEIDFSNKELKKRLSISPLSDLKIIFEKYLAQILTAILFTILYLIFVNYKIGKYYKITDLLLINISVIIHSLCIVSIANAIFNITSNKKLLNGLINILTLIVSFVSGIFIPEKFLPKSIKAIANFFPTRYYINFINDVSIKNLISFTATQILFIIFFLSVSILIKRYKKTS